MRSEYSFYDSVDCSQNKICFVCFSKRYLPIMTCTVIIVLAFIFILLVEQQGKGKLRASVKTGVEPSLFAWLFQMGGEVRLVGPKKLTEQLRERAKSLAKSYKS